MDFFSSQDQARRKTGRLILLFGAAVLSLVAITSVLVLVALDMLESTALLSQGALPVIAGVTAVILIVVMLGSLYKMAALAGGGARVAEMLNGRLLVQGSQDLHERRVLNVVEEMALASGTPVPPVFLIEENGINAFAAGYAPQDAVIGVTRGAITSLTRDELQGVIAHEFSHILNGDMRMNIRLMSILHGILVLGIIGRVLLRSSSRGRRSKNGGGIVVLGLGLFVIGYTGIFFGNLIKAAVSRQREFLADASSVQFTRNPQGIGHALMRIATHANHSYLANPRQEEISHALFEEGSPSRFASLFATHPPLPDRIRSVMPNWDGRFELPPLPAPGAEEPAETPSAAERSIGPAVGGMTGMAIADALINGAGQPEAGNVVAARQILQDLPPPLKAAAREPAGARAVIYLMLLAADSATRQRQLDTLARNADSGVHQELLRLLALTGDPEIRLRLPLIKIAMGTLRQLSLPQYRTFRSNLELLISADERISLFEWVLQKIVARQLDSVFEKKPVPAIGRRDLTTMTAEVNVLLSFLANTGSRDASTAGSAFAAAAASLNSLKLERVPPEQLDLLALDQALAGLVQVKALQKPALLKACAACIMGDGIAGAEELELFHGFADTLDCPLPPLI